MPLPPEVFGFSIFLKHFPVLQLNERLDLGLLQVREFNWLMLHNLLLDILIKLSPKDLIYQNQIKVIEVN